MADRVLLTDEQWEKLRAQFPEPDHELVRIPVQPGEIVLRNPSEAEYHAHQAAIWGVEGEAGRPAAYRNALVMQCVHPDKPTLTAWLKRWPGIALNPKVVRAINYLSGQIETLEGKA